MKRQPPAREWPVPPADLAALADRMRALPSSALVALLARLSRECDLWPHLEFAMDRRNETELHMHGVGVQALASRARDQHDRIMRAHYGDKRAIPEFPKNVVRLVPGKRGAAASAQYIASSPETGHLDVERAPDGSWQVHHVDWHYDHAAIPADSLPSRLEALRSLFSYALGCIHREMTRWPSGGDDGGRAA